MSEPKVVEKVIRVHYGDSPIKGGWYYCVVVFNSGATNTDLVYYDSMYDEWQHRGNEKGVVCWIEPLDELLREN